MTLSMPGVRGGSITTDRLLLEIIISVDLARLRHKLFSFDLLSILSVSSMSVFVLVAGTIKYVLSAYFNILFPWTDALRSLAVIMKPIEPRAEP